MSSCKDHIVLMISMFIMFSMVKGQPQVPCYFIFGDSIVDNGNNNNLITTAKANYFPYGIDFPNGPQNGRFTNGRNKADFIAELIGFNSSIPPHATASGNEILRGVNYGSGVAGIRDETGIRWGDRISMNRQLLNHQVTILRINSILRNITATRSLLNKCLYTVDMGNNDYLNNYLDPTFYPSSRLYTPDRFATILVQQFEGQLRRLHRYGARKVAVSNIGLLGCLPEETRTYGRNASGCVDFINNYVQLFNQKLKVSIDNLNTNLPNARFIISNQTSISTGGPPIGFTVFDSPCCIISNTTAKGQCSNNGQTPCSNRNQYVFFDNFHPTEAANRAIATRSNTALLPTDSYPTDIRGLVQT
ncbi:GDSL esterase/lipase At1g29670-like [Solanum tuberosum]|uniref:Zinc finger protein n=1 Tax=Solanum tuberosum TaxID=4113 RepID=M1B1I5_SOLTU|nr:PREDICTED: GDSL esterase/lipase At1g29670-like [Solanum tuberosum]